MQPGGSAGVWEGVRACGPAAQATEQRRNQQPTLHFASSPSAMPACTSAAPTRPPAAARPSPFLGVSANRTSRSVATMPGETMCTPTLPLPLPLPLLPSAAATSAASESFSWTRARLVAPYAALPGVGLPQLQRGRAGLDGWARAQLLQAPQLPPRSAHPAAVQQHKAQPRLPLPSTKKTLPPPGCRCMRAMAARAPSSAPAGQASRGRRPPRRAALPAS